MDKPELTDSIQDLKDYLHEHWEEGVRCGGCDQLVKLYKRTIYGIMVYSLIQLYKLPRGEYHHIGKLVKAGVAGGGDFAKLVYWGLVEEEPKDPENKEKRTSGMWKITPTGVAFVENRQTVPRYARVYDSRFLGLIGDQIGVKDVIGKKFNYEDLMGGVS